jgi:hypothetical protein
LPAFEKMKALLFISSTTKLSLTVTTVSGGVAPVLPPVNDARDCDPKGDRPVGAKAHAGSADERTGDRGEALMTGARPGPNRPASAAAFCSTNPPRFGVRKDVTTAGPAADAGSTRRSESGTAYACPEVPPVTRAETVAWPRGEAPAP